MDRCIVAGEQMLIRDAGDVRLRTKLLGAYKWRFEDFGCKTDLDKVIEMAGDLIREWRVAKPFFEKDLYSMIFGYGLMQRFAITEDLRDLELSVHTYEEMVRNDSVESHFGTDLMVHLGLGLANLFISTHSIDTIHRAIAITEESVRLAAYGGWSQHVARSALAICLARRAWETQHLEHINDAIVLMEEINSNRSRIRIIRKPLGYMFAGRFGISGSLNDYHSAIEQFIAAEILPFDPLEEHLATKHIGWNRACDFGRSVKMENTTSTSDPQSLVAAIAAHFGRQISGTTIVDHLGFLDRAIEVGKACLAATPSGHAGRDNVRTELYSYFQKKANYTGDSRCLDEAVHVFYPFGPETTCYDMGDVETYAWAVDMRFRANGDTSGIDSAIHALQEIAREVVPRESFISIRLENEASRPASWVRTLGPPSDAKAIPILLPLADLQGRRYLAFGNMVDLNAAIENMERVIAKLPFDGQDSAAGFAYFSLSVFLMTRLKRYPASKDYEDAMHFCNIALELNEKDDRAKSDLLGLRSSLLAELSIAASTRNLDKGIADARLAFEIAQDHEQQATHLISLGGYLLMKHDKSGHVNDLEEAIRSIREGLAMLAGEALGGKSRHVSILGLRKLSTCLLDRAKLSNDAHCMSDLDEAIHASEDAASQLAENDPLGVGIYWGLGCAYQARLEHQANGLPKKDEEETTRDLALAAKAFSECVLASKNEAPIQIEAGLRAVPLLRSLQRGKELVSLLKHAFSKLSPIAPRYLPRDAQLNNLSRGISGKVAKAAAVLLEEGAEPQEALALLDSGRGILASRALQLRADTSMLDAPTAIHFKKLLHKLRLQERSRDSSTNFTIRASHEKHEGLEKEVGKDGLESGCTDQRNRHADSSVNIYDRFQAEEDLEALLTKIRSNPSTKTFLGPPDVDQVVKALGNNTLIAINNSKPYHTFIINRLTGLHVIKLTNLNTEDLSKWTRDLRRNRPFLDPTMLEWLWTSIADPILQEIHVQKIQHAQSTNSLPRIIWMPIGRLSHFPLHAAGFHGQPYRTVIDCAISSYTSSLTALVLGRSKIQRYHKDPTPGKAVLVGMDNTNCANPETPTGFVSLPFAREEICLVETFCRPLGLKTIPMSSARRSEVISSIDECTLFHFAGHGVSNPGYPTKSGLAIQDDLLTVFQLQEHRSNRLNEVSSQRSPFLAYLSACLTGSHDSPKVLDEGINIISGFQLGGFRHVIGTMWQVSDKYCVEFARMFYKGLAGKGLVDSAISLALHEAMVSARDVWIKTQSEQDVVYVREGPGEVLEDSKYEGEYETDEEDAERKAKSEWKRPEAPRRKLVRAWWVSYVHFGP